jgi:hypothetical protein
MKMINGGILPQDSNEDERRKLFQNIKNLM